MSKETQVQTVNESQIVPAYMQGADLGLDVIENEDVITPRIKICQAMSTSKDSMDGIKDGQWYTSAGKILGDSVDFFVLTKYNSRVWYGDGNKLIGYESTNPKTKEVTKFGEKIDEIMSNQALYSTGKDTYNYIVVLEKDLKDSIENGGSPVIYIYSAQSAARGAAKKLNSMLKMAGQRGIPIYANRVGAATEKKQFDNGAAYMPTFSDAGYAGKEEFEALKGGYELAVMTLGNSNLHKEDNETPFGDDESLDPFKS